MGSLESMATKTIEVYNKYRNPEAIATLLECKENRIIVEFEGSLCTSCGTYDYLEDFAYEFKDVTGSHLEIAKVEIGDDEKFRVIYVLKKPVG